MSTMPSNGIWYLNRVHETHAVVWRCLASVIVTELQLRFWIIVSSEEEQIAKVLRKGFLKTIVTHRMTASMLSVERKKKTRSKAFVWNSKETTKRPSTTVKKRSPSSRVDKCVNTLSISLALSACDTFDFDFFFRTNVCNRSERIEIVKREKKNKNSENRVSENSEKKMQNNLWLKHKKKRRKKNKTKIKRTFFPTNSSILYHLSLLHPSSYLSLLLSIYHYLSYSSNRRQFTFCCSVIFVKLIKSEILQKIQTKLT